MRIITTHLGADFDALGAAMGMRLLVPDARLAFPGSQEVAVRRFLEAERIALPEVRVRELRRGRIEQAVVVDCSSLRRLGEVGELIVASGCPVEVVDHHQDPADLIPGASVLTADVASTCTVVTRELQRRRVEPDVLTASLLLLGVYEDTGGLTYVDTTAADLEAAAWLLARGARLEWVRRYVLRPLEPEQLELLNQLVEGAVEHQVAGCRVVISVARPSERLEEAAYVVHRYAEIFDLPVVMVLLEVPPQLVVIARSTVPEVDAGRLMAGIGGGGHATAAAARLRGRSAVEVSEELLGAIAQALSARWTAASLATPFLHTCDAGSTVEEVKERLTRLRINAMPVQQGEALIGVVTRQILDQALAAGMGDRPVTLVMRPGIPEAPPDASPEELQRLFMESHNRFVLVRLPSGWGVLTRMDLFRRLYERQLAEGARLDRRVASTRLVVQDLGKQLARALPPRLLEVLTTAGELAAADGMRAFLVGGAVRDVLLGRPVEDVDVVVEGNGMLLAGRLAKAFGGRSHPHEPFLTAAVHLPEDVRVDVATARTEFYRRPAALPEVETSAIRQDLYRRDFTINAMAMSLAPGHLGELLDFFGGRRDIERRVVRVLHSLSFLDDPTRVLRAVRFTTRLGFGIAAETRHLIGVAVGEGVFARLSGERLRDELAELLEEDHPAEALGELAGLSVFEAVFPGVAWSVSLRRFIGQLHEVLAWAALEEVGEKARWPTYLVALATRSGERGGETLARRLSLSGRLGQMVAQARPRIEKALSALAQDHIRPSEVVRLLEHTERAVILVTMAMAGEETRRLLRQGLSVWQRTPAPVTGACLRAAGVPPGKLLGEALQRTRDAVIDGEVSAHLALEHAVALARGERGGRR